MKIKKSLIVANLAIFNKKRKTPLQKINFNFSAVFFSNLLSSFEFSDITEENSFIDDENTKKESKPKVTVVKNQFENEMNFDVEHENIKNVIVKQDLEISKKKIEKAEIIQNFWDKYLEKDENEEEENDFFVETDNENMLLGKMKLEFGSENFDFRHEKSNLLNYSFDDKFLKRKKSGKIDDEYRENFYNIKKEEIEETEDEFLFEPEKIKKKRGPQQLKWQNYKLSKLSEILKIRQPDILGILENFFPERKNSQKNQLFVKPEEIKKIIEFCNLPNKMVEKEKKEIIKKMRHPVVCVLGHVDHGKTTLIDAIRSSSIASGEAGGITQSIGAFVVKINENDKITLIDTPGHEAFSNMRKRGVSLVDSAILVIAADDGVTETTKECIKMLDKYKIKFVVAINKIDVKKADVEKTKRDLMSVGIYSEENGGEHTLVEISAKQKINIKELIEFAHFEGNYKDLNVPQNVPAKASILEVSHSQKFGVIFNAIVTEGVLREEQIFVCGSSYGKVRQMRNFEGDFIEECFASFPVSFSGVKELNSLDKTIEVFDSIDSAKLEVDKRISQTQRESQYKAPELTREEKLAIKEKLELEKTMPKKKKIKKGPRILKIILKAKENGLIETVTNLVNSIIIPEKDVKLEILESSIGEITKTTVQQSKLFDAIVLGFQVESTKNALSEAKMLSVQIHEFDIIYSLQDFLIQTLEKMLTPTYDEINRGTALIKKLFKTTSKNKLGVRPIYAGCEVLSGVVQTKNSHYGFFISRDGEKIYHSRKNIIELRRFKEVVQQVSSGKECGIDLGEFKDHKEGDIITFFELVPVKNRIKCVFDGNFNS